MRALRARMAEGIAPVIGGPEGGVEAEQASANGRSPPRQAPEPMTV
ncbi:hypothetical protein [Methylobacterium sp. J-068]|nr:hypothetical protein [Methylobacterium sp. J-068]MCJ2037098.1 hypothetical protein [Methylobacterium sp. J-068]